MSALLDHALTFQLLQIAGSHADDLTVYLCIMLLQQRRRLYVGGRVLQLYRTSRHRELAAHRMVYRHDHTALAHMRIVEQFDAVEHGAARNAGSTQHLHHFVLVMLTRPFLDNPREFLHVFLTFLSLLDARIMGKVWPSN